MLDNPMPTFKFIKVFGNHESADPAHDNYDFTFVQLVYFCQNLNLMALPPF